jgi:hypothetical protein
MGKNIKELKLRANDTEIVIALKIKERKGIYNAPRKVMVGAVPLSIGPTDDLMVKIIGMSDIELNKILRKRVLGSVAQDKVEIEEIFTAQRYIGCEPASARNTVMLVWIGFGEPSMTVGRIYVIKGLLKHYIRGGTAILVQEFEEKKDISKER